MSRELEVVEYILGLDALGLGLGTAAHAMRKRTLIEVRPLLLRQFEHCSVAEGLGRQEPWTSPGIDEGRAAQLDAKGAELGRQIDAAWERCLEQLKILYLTSGAVVAEELH